jgi:hypothetical protein
MGIRMHGKGDQHPCRAELPAKHTWCGKTIRDVAYAGEKAGLPEHVYDVLGAFLLNEINQTQLFGDAIQGVSRWMLRHRVTTEEVTFLRDALAEMDIKTIRGAVRHHGIAPRSPQIAFLVADHMEAALWGLRQ